MIPELPGGSDKAGGFNETEKVLNCLLDCGTEPARYFKHSEASDIKDFLSNGAPGKLERSYIKKYSRQTFKRCFSADIYCGRDYERMAAVGGILPSLCLLALLFLFFFFYLHSARCIAAM